jgi:hypothetical protein
MGLVKALLPLLAALLLTGNAGQGEIRLPHVSGAAFLRDGKLALVDAEPNGALVLDDALARLRSGPLQPLPAEALATQLKGKIEIQDVEDAAWDGRGELFLAGSHARNPLGESPEARYRLARLRFDATGKLLEARQSDALLHAIQIDVPFLADAIRRTPARAGLNIEGLAFTPDGTLLVGLRSPTITESTPRPHGGQEDAVVLRITNPDALFDDPPQPAQLGETVKLDLRGQGIRGMAWDPGRKGVWLLAGLSVEPTHPVTSPWALWFWDQKTPARRAALPGDIRLVSPEAVATTQIDGNPQLLIIDDGAPSSRFALIPTPGLE